MNRSLLFVANLVGGGSFQIEIVGCGANRHRNVGNGHALGIVFTEAIRRVVL